MSDRYVQQLLFSHTHECMHTHTRTRTHAHTRMGLCVCSRQCDWWIYPFFQIRKLACGISEADYLKHVYKGYT